MRTNTHTFGKLAVAAALSISTVGSAIAGPLARENVSAKAKWLIHLDADRLRASQVGRFLIENVVEKKVAAVKANHHFDFSPLVRSLKAATAYGTDHHQDPSRAGVLLLQASPEAVTDLGTALAGWLTAEESSGATSGRIQRVGDRPGIYRIDQDTFIAPLQDGRLLFGKSLEHVRLAHRVLDGSAPSLKSTGAMADVKPDQTSAILMAAIEDLNKSPALAPHAKVLRKADHGRLLLDERDGRMLLKLSLDAETEETAAQVQQLVEGVLAWVALEKTENEELQTLVKSAKVGVAARTVTASFEYPVDPLLKFIERKHRP